MEDEVCKSLNLKETNQKIYICSKTNVTAVVIEKKIMLENQNFVLILKQNQL